MNRRNLLLKIQYDGSRYHGYQIQPDVITVQQSVEETLSRITGEEIHINGCSRTDAGVHAVEYCCNFFTSFPIPAERLPIVLNNTLPDDIMAISCMEVPDDFHARFDTKAKTYRYKIKCNKNPDVFDRKYTWHLKKELDVLKMQEACKYFVGEHDFKSFMSAGNQVESSVRCIYSLDVVKKSSDLIEIYIKANGYLYNMVRIITGTLVDIGLNRYEPEFVTEIINAKDRSKAGPTAPPQGLSLYKVEY